MPTSMFTPTRQNLAICQGKLAAARRGYEILKRKTDSIRLRYRRFILELRNIIKEFNHQSLDAYFSLTQATYGAGNFHTVLLESPAITASFRLRVIHEQYAGIRIPHLIPFDTGRFTNEKFLGLAGGGLQIKHCKEKNKAYLEYLCNMASLRIGLQVLTEALKISSCRMNALESIVIPKYESSYEYILRELEEIEREDFNRIKIMLDRKHKIAHKKDMDELISGKTAKDSSSIEEDSKTYDEDSIIISKLKIASPIGTDSDRDTDIDTDSDMFRSRTCSALTGFDSSDEQDIVFLPLG
eukprot:gene5402-10804_t